MWLSGGIGTGNIVRAPCGAFDHASGADRTGNMTKGRAEAPPQPGRRPAARAERPKGRGFAGEQRAIAEPKTNDTPSVEFSYVYRLRRGALAAGLICPPLGERQRGGSFYRSGLYTNHMFFTIFPASLFLSAMNRRETPAAAQPCIEVNTSPYPIRQPEGGFFDPHFD